MSRSGFAAPSFLSGFILSEGEWRVHDRDEFRTDYCSRSRFFHLQAVEHARHTAKRAEAYASALFAMMLRVGFRTGRWSSYYSRLQRHPQRQHPQLRLPRQPLRQRPRQQ